MRFGHDPSYRVTMSGDDDVLHTLDVIGESWERRVLAFEA
jgi:hypothetical protein